MLIKDTDFIDKPVLAKGKVRNIYDLGDSLLLVVTDRISAFDVIFDELIPELRKLNQVLEYFTPTEKAKNECDTAACALSSKPNTNDDALTMFLRSFGL